MFCFYSRLRVYLFTGRYVALCFLSLWIFFACSASSGNTFSSPLFTGPGDRLYCQEIGDTGSHLCILQTHVKAKAKDDSVLRPDSVWFIRNAEGQNIRSGKNCEGAVYGIEITRNRKYVGINRVAEGHAWVEIQELSKLLKRGVCSFEQELVAYPGDLVLVGATQNRFRIQSTVNLKGKKKGDSFKAADLLDKPRVYLYDPVGGHFFE